MRDEFKGPIHGGVYFWNFTVIMKAGDSSPHIFQTNDRFSFKEICGKVRHENLALSSELVTIKLPP